jgi:subtilisin family serine protease
MSRFGLPSVTESDNPLPPRVMGYISVVGKASVFARPTKRPKTAKAYHATKQDRESVAKDLTASGFEIVAESALGLSVWAEPAQFEELTGGTITPKERLMHTTDGVFEYITCLDIVGAKQPAAFGVGRVKSKALPVDGVVLELPRQFHAVFPSPIPLSSSKFHLRVPDDVAVALGAQAAHQQGVRGEHVTVVMPDSGWYRHPFFTANAYSVKTPIAAVPGTNRSKDPIGHGTGESANIFAVAPGATLQPIRGTDSAGNFVGVIAAFLKGKALSPQIMTNSWGGDGEFPPLGGPDQGDLAFAAEVQDAIDNGILVIFSAGNGQFSIEPQIPGVLAAGGVFIDQNGQMRASDYASGYKSPWFDVVVPTVCGLVGMQPRAQYLMLPVQPGCELDRAESVFDDGEEGDGTNDQDGWALFSGTSAAAPQIAGAAALILSAKPNLKPAQVITALSETATDVVVGRSFPQRFNEQAAAGFDNATGFGLINAGAAVKFAQDHF